jgi:O-antigen ligase
VLLLLALTIHLGGDRPRGYYMLLLILATVAIWTTGCRAVMFGSLVFLGGLYSQKLFDLARTLAVIVIIVFLFVVAVPDAFKVIYKASGIQSEIRMSYDQDGIGGREEIWQRRIDFLRENPSVWLMGSGPGSDTFYGGNAHNLFLEILLEHGLIGLIVFLWATSFVMANVYAHDSAPKAMFWAILAILISSLGQVTLYPIPWTGHFIGFYLCTIAIVLRRVRILDAGKTGQYVMGKNAYNRWITSRRVAQPIHTGTLLRAKHPCAL